jgi:RNA polymerase sigma-70 factor (ECF subfamily)
MDSSAFIEPYRHELYLHCYRLLGSLHDAEDLVQETMLRAWQHFGTFKGTSTLRTWLYSIATHACLDFLKKRSRRTMPMVSYAPSEPTETLPRPVHEVPWLEPFPDAWLDEVTYNPEAHYTRRESISFAFLTAIQLLTPRQRAILILTDVLDWQASEVAHLLSISVSAVNSALHRSRTSLEKHYHRDERELAQPAFPDAATSALLQRYVHAWENDDVKALVETLKEDATLNMPPYSAWYQGREAIQRMLALAAFHTQRPGQWRLFPARANGQLAYVFYHQAEAQQTYRATGVQMVTLDGTQAEPRIGSLTIFLTASLAPFFDLPVQLAQEQD